MTDPLVQSDVDLRDFAFMPVDIQRLFNSEFHARASDAEWRAGVTLWLKSFHQVPAASLPNDDIALARLAEFGRDVKGWLKVKKMALYGWVECTDARLYHPVVAEKVNEAWQRKQSFRDRTEKARIARQSQRQSQALLQTTPSSVTDASGVSNRIQGTGTGTETGTGTGTEKRKEGSAAAPPSALSLLLAEGVDRQVAVDWLAIRKAQKAPLTETALAGVRREAAAAGLSVAAAVKVSVERGWRGFKADWLGSGFAPGNGAGQVNGRHPAPAMSRDASDDDVRRMTGELL